MGGGAQRDEKSYGIILNFMQFNAETHKIN